MKLNKYKMKIGIPESVEFLVYGKDQVNLNRVNSMTLIKILAQIESHIFISSMTW